MKSVFTKLGLVFIIVSILQTAELNPEGIQQVWFIMGSLAFMLGDWNWKLE